MALIEITGKFPFVFFRDNKIVEPEIVDTKTKLISGQDSDFLPMRGGRSSIQPQQTTFAPNGKLNAIQPDFAVEWLSTLENLAAFSPDFSLAINNIIFLANTEHEIYFSDEVPDKIQSEMKSWIKNNEAKWYGYSDGSRSLKADLLTQIAINGCLSAEIVPTNKLDNIKQIVRVSPKYIRFVYDKENDSWHPYQQLSGYVALKDSGLHKLNTTTYKYIAHRRYFESPYGTPPLITAIEGLNIQRDMIGNFKNIMQKLGMLGFLSAEVTPPEELPNESPEEYVKRCTDYLDNTVYRQLENNLSKGIVAGFKDSHKFELQGNNMNVNGADGLMKIVKQLINAGVKQDPNLMGQNYSTTESFGRVILAIMVAQTSDYQAIVDSFYENIYLMALRLAGYNPGYVQVKSKKPLINDEVKEAQADSIKIDNVKKKRDMGLISQDQAAQELGYDEPDSDGDISTVEPTNTNVPKDNQDITGTNQNNRINVLEQSLNSVVTEYNYSVHGCGINITRESFIEYTDFSDEKLNKFMKSYFDALNKDYSNAVNSICTTLKHKLSTINKNVGLESLQREVYLHILENWENEFVSEFLNDVQKNTSKIYHYYRNDKSIFDTTGQNSNSRSFSNDIADAVLNLSDYRAIEYMKSSDIMYLGKFITDKDTKKRIYKYIEKYYIENGAPTGNSKTEIDEFIKEFKKDLKLEAWKIRRILDTTVNKIKNFANTYYLQQIEVQEYEVIEMIDNLTCGYCTHMNHQVFKVSTAVNRIKKEVDSGPENLSKVAPFVTSIPLAQFSELNNSELSSKGHLLPSFHPHCRGRIIARFAS